MQKLLFVLFFSIFSMSFSASVQPVIAQTAADSEAEDRISDEKRWLRGDLKAAEVVAYVDIKNVKLIDELGAKGNCEKGTGGGYCLYLLTADVKEVFKSEIKTKTLEFTTVTEPFPDQNRLLGERIVFLVWSENEARQKKSLGTIENSSRGADPETLKTMREIVDVNAPIDDADASNPYSLKSLKKNFAEADAVVLADVKQFRKNQNDQMRQEFALDADVREVFKGELKSGAKIEFFDDLLYRSFNKEDLGEQLIFLTKETENGKTFYTRVSYAADFIKGDVLEKIKTVSGKR